ncbi:MAG TPA: ribulose-phosphate 3-epimerase [Proteobacteria bacterium]|nr:ribulose-phosphate 3-epimerase [bacterium BMS3Abin14]HDL53321.1 ribulose-phosphate 3-epimerase [Pseudomonadota bacterium]
MRSGEVLIAPSILSADFSRLCEEIQAVEEAGADIIHLDIMDGHFVPNITIGPVVLSSLRKCTDLPFDCHLMIENPDRFIEAFADAGADMISVHQEACTHLDRSLNLIRENGAKAGIVFNPATGMDQLRYTTDLVDYILLMSVNPGFGGQKFIPGSLGKLRDLTNLLDELKMDVQIEIDGGIRPENAGDVIEAGARILVAGSAIFHNPPYGEVISRMRNPVLVA